jgi:hypothetical protein
MFNLAYRNSISENPNGLPDATVDITRDSPIAGLHVATGLPPDAAAAQVELVHHSVATGLSLAWAAGAVILALGTFVVMLTHPKDSPRSLAKAAAKAAAEANAAAALDTGTPTWPAPGPVGESPQPIPDTSAAPVLLLAAQSEAMARIVTQLESITARLDRLEANGANGIPVAGHNGHALIDTASGHDHATNGCAAIGYATNGHAGDGVETTALRWRARDLISSQVDPQ